MARPRKLPYAKVLLESRVTQIHRVNLIRWAILGVLCVSRWCHDQRLWDRTGGLSRFPPDPQRGLQGSWERNSVEEVAGAMMHRKLGGLS